MTPDAVIKGLMAKEVTRDTANAALGLIERLNADLRHVAVGSAEAGLDRKVLDSMMAPLRSQPR